MKIIFKILPYLIFFLLLIFAKSNAEQKDHSFGDLNKNIFQVQDTTQSPKSHSKFGVAGTIRLAFGHHDNLTKAKTFGGPKLKISNTYWHIYIEGGGAYKIASAGISGTYMAPIPRTKTVGSYKHEGELDDKGIWLRLRLLPPRSKFDLNTLAGYRWVNEFARILDQTDTNPDSLNLDYKDRGPLFGGELQYALRKLPDEGELRLILGYTHENLRSNRVNKYRIETGLFGQVLQKNLEGKEYLDLLSFISLGIEFVRWSDGRNDWFIVGSFGVLGWD